MKKEFDASDFMLALMVALVVFAILGAVWFMVADENPTTTLITYDGVEYKCWHYPDGDMDCASVLDPEIGGGKAEGDA